VALLVEGANDTYMPGICGGLITTMFYDHAGAFPELYRYTFPRQGLIDMMNPRRHSGMRPEHMARRACKLLYRAFVDGMYLWHYDLMEDNCYQPDDPQTPRVKKTDDLRRAWLTRYGRGIFRDALGLTASCGDGPPVRAAGRQRIDRLRPGRRAGRACDRYPARGNVARRRPDGGCA